MNSAETSLAVYGSLAPGCPNHHVLSDLQGRWIEATVRGTLHKDGWGSELGFPGIVLDPEGPEVPVQVFQSSALPQHWARLDEFEGPGYQRTTTIAVTAAGVIPTSIYALAQT